MDGWNTTSLLGWPIFKGENVSFREGKVIDLLPFTSSRFQLWERGGLGTFDRGTSRSRSRSIPSNQAILDLMHCSQKMPRPAVEFGITHTIYGIFTYMKWLLSMVNVGKYTSPMDAMG